MTAEFVTAAIGKYLKQVESHAQGMPSADRAVLLRDLESHIHEALRDRFGDQPTEANVQVVIAEMDPPESFAQVEASAPHEKPKGRKGTWGLCISIGTTMVLAPVLFCLTQYVPLWVIFVAFLCGQFTAMVLGIIDWKARIGKAAVIVAVIQLVLVLLGFVG